MNRAVSGFIGQLTTALTELSYTIDPTIEARRFRTPSKEGIRYGVRVSLLRDEAHAEWNILDAYQRPTLFTRLNRRASKYFSLTHEGNQELRKAAVNFAREIKADIYPASDLPTLLEINSSEPLDKRNPSSTFVEDVLRYATALIQVAQQPISIPPTPKLTPLPVSQPTRAPVKSQHVQALKPPPKRYDRYLHFRLHDFELWELRDSYPGEYDGDFKAIPEEELERIGWTRRITGDRPKIIDIQKKDSTSKS